MDDDVVARWKAQVEKFPDNELPRFSLAKAYIDAGAYEEAIETLKDAITIKSDWMAAKIMLARALIHLQRYDEARPMLEESRNLAHQLGHESPIQEIDEMIEQLPKD